jgi:hypothetical protein
MVYSYCLSTFYACSLRKLAAQIPLSFDEFYPAHESGGESIFILYQKMGDTLR